jgi:hypothetical protein
MGVKLDHLLFGNKEIESVSEQGLEPVLEFNRHEIIKECKALHSKEFNNLFSPPSI